MVTSAQAGARVLAERLPAGSGVLAVGGPGVAWSIEERCLVPVLSADDDPVVLLRHLVGALGDAGLEVDDVATALSGPAPNLSRHVLPLLAEVAAGSVTPFLLVLDDLHAVSRDEAVHFADELLRLLPPDCTVVLAGRSLPDMRLARWEVDGLLARFDESDLAYTEPEAHRVLAAALPDLSQRLEREVMRVTLGWPAGMHLAILALRDARRSRSRRACVSQSSALAK